jgi:phosphatidate phosphatase APP1
VAGIFFSYYSWLNKAKLSPKMQKTTGVKIYHGYGHTHDLFVFGHVFRALPAQRSRYTSNPVVNILQLLKLFFVKPLPRVRVQLIWYDQLLEGISESDGFFKFEWKATHEMTAGWHLVKVQSLDEKGNITGKGEGKLFIPHSTQYAFISDIDDTIMISHSATILKRLKELFVRNPRTRNVFPDIARHYDLLAEAHTLPQTANPFFYVSSSEWNLYDYLRDFFDHHKLPQGAFLLNQVKRWYELWKTGKTKHEGKLLRVVRILHAFPKQRFILFGDNSQSDPGIYAALADKYPQQIFAVYIRNIVPKNGPVTQEVLARVREKGVETCLFNDSAEAIEHSRKIGLIH